MGHVFSDHRRDGGGKSYVHGTCRRREEGRVGGGRRECAHSLIFPFITCAHSPDLAGFSDSCQRRVAIMEGTRDVCSPDRRWAQGLWRQTKIKRIA